MTKICRNPRCNELLIYEHNPLGYCPSCRFIEARGMFLGGFIVGAIAGVLKLAGWL